MAKDPRFASNTLRVQNRPALNAAIAEAFSLLDTASTLERLSFASTAYGQLRSVADFARHPALRTWPMRVGGEDLDLVAPPVRTPWDSGRHASAPELGEHSKQLRLEFAGQTSSEVCIQATEVQA